ncbi:hypothetical protein AB0M92_19145 [Streptomyces sp. NPDC051582]|uniref:hypothetical protein n=1 Tax=Streptomyces sp. NPDC051582 TaxID=3155167 RepID=UPI00342236B1
MALIRKAAAGADSFGHVWPEDGAVVEIDNAEEIAALMAIPDAGFSEVVRPTKKAKADEPKDSDPSDGEELSEVDPKAEDVETPPAKKTAARKTAASKPE